MSPKRLELRQDHKLIRSNFDGYKLSLDPVPVFKEDLTAAPHVAKTSDDQYSLLHAELFSLQNLLQIDPWERHTSYFVNQLGEIVRCAYDLKTGRPQALVVVFVLSEDNQQRPRVEGDYNYSMRFISEKFCVLCDGINQLQLFDTGDRLKAGKWVLVAVTNIHKEKVNFSIYDCRLDVISERKQISCALGHVQRVDPNETGSYSRHIMQLHLTRWLQDVESGEWKFSIIDVMIGKGSLYYCTYEPRAKCIVISSNAEFKFASKSKSINFSKEGQANDLENAPQLHDESAEVSGFSWWQTTEDVVIKFDQRENKSISNYTIQSIARKLYVKCDEEVLFDRELFTAVDPDLTTWAIEKNCLHITLFKEAASATRWPMLVAEGVAPKESFENSGKDLVEQKPVANLETPVEDCDLPADDDEVVKIVRYVIDTKKVSHSAYLGNAPPLFTTILRPGYPAAVATRQNVDACLWLPQWNPSKPDDWSLRHEGNLHAFGYIQASKQAKRFIDCAPDLSYAIICESHRHIFLYKSDHDNSSGLRNRSGAQITMGKQYLITLEDAEIVGVCTAVDVITVLTTKNIVYIQIN